MKTALALLFYSVILFSLVLQGCKRKTVHYQPAYGNDTKEKKVFLFGVPNQSYYELTDSIVKYLNDHLKGIRVQTVATTTYGKYNEQLAQGYYDLTITNGITAVDAIHKGYMIVGKVVDQAGNTGSIIVNKDSSINEFSDLKGKTIATPGAPALSGYVLQMLYLTKKGIDVNRDLKFKHFESYESVFLNVYLGKCSAGFSSTISWNAFIKRRPEIASRVVEKWQTPGIVGSAILFRTDMDERIAAQLKGLFLSMHTNEQGRTALAKIRFLRCEAADSNSYQQIKEVMNNYTSVIKDHK
ncbi:MAG: phosphate/phosphite/phosphonate ABC transporter substrate-binding protein [Flavisolibacter sp.]